jgi:hemerythrin-like domain-containing protein
VKVIEMANPVTAWHDEHAYFKLLLDLLHRQVDLLPRAEQPDYELMLDIISYLREYSDHCHHPREDVAFKLLEERCPDLALPLARLRQEHRVIAHAGDIFAQLLEAGLREVVMPLSELETAAAMYLVYYGNHIAREEEVVLPRAAQVLTPADWEVVRAAVPTVRDPLFGERPEERYRELRRRIARETRHQAGASPPA